MRVLTICTRTSLTRTRQQLQRWSSGCSTVLASSPIIRAVPDCRRVDLRELLERPYRVIYRITRERIEIVTIKHYRQRLPQHPEFLE